LTVHRTAWRSARLSDRGDNTHFKGGAVLESEGFGVAGNSSSTSSRIGTTWSAITIFEGTQNTSWTVNAAVLSFHEGRTIHTISKFRYSNSAHSNLETVTTAGIAITPRLPIGNLAISIAWGGGTWASLSELGRAIMAAT
jgi:hypothetical protein